MTSEVEEPHAVEALLEYHGQTDLSTPARKKERGRHFLFCVAGRRATKQKRKQRGQEARNLERRRQQRQLPPPQYRANKSNAPEEHCRRERSPKRTPRGGAKQGGAWEGRGRNAPPQPKAAHLRAALTRDLPREKPTQTVQTQAATEKEEPAKACEDYQQQLAQLK